MLPRWSEEAGMVTMDTNTASELGPEKLVDLTEEKKNTGDAQISLHFLCTGLR